MSAELDVITTDRADAWKAVLAACPDHDVYHLAEYHRVAEELGQGEAALFAIHQRGHVIALPLLIRPCSDGSLDLERLVDATSVYGYPGPIASTRDVTANMQQTFADSLRLALEERGVVSLCSRMNPLLSLGPPPAGYGEEVVAGTTVSIDLTLSENEQVARYRQNHKRDLRKLARRGVQCDMDADFRRAHEFIDLYHETMARLGAGRHHYVGYEHLAMLRRRLEDRVALFVCTLDGELICGGVFFFCNGIVQYHLGATRGDFLKSAPSKLLFDTVRRYGASRRMRLLHLGGGLGGRRDSLFHFKAGFSDRRHPFTLWRWIVRPEAYQRLCSARSRRLSAEGNIRPSPDYFPAYRAPAAS